MKITHTKSNGSLNVTLEGRLDTTTAPELESFLDQTYAEGEALVFHCEDLAYVSSAGLRVFLSMQKKTKGNMTLANVCDLVMEVFEMTGFADILTFA